VQYQLAVGSSQLTQRVTASGCLRRQPG